MTIEEGLKIFNPSELFNELCYTGGSDHSIASMRFGLGAGTKSGELPTSNIYVLMQLLEGNFGRGQVCSWLQPWAEPCELSETVKSIYLRWRGTQ